MFAGRVARRWSTTHARPRATPSPSQEEAPQSRRRPPPAPCLAAVQKMTEEGHKSVAQPKYRTGATPLQPEVVIGRRDPIFRQMLEELNGHATRGDVSHTLACFDRMAVRVGDPTSLGQPVELPTVVWNTVLKAFANAADLTGARAWFARMCSASIRVNEKTYGKLIETASKSGQLKEAEALFAELSAVKFKPPPPPRRSAAISPVLAQEGGGRGLVAFGAVLDGCARTGDAVGATAWLARVVQARLRPDTASYNSVVAALGNSGDPVQASKMLEAAVKWLDAMESGRVSPDEVTLTAVVNSFARSDEAKEAERWLGKMVDLELKPNVISYTAVINGYARKGDVENADRIFQNMVQTNGLAPDMLAYSALVGAFVRAGDPDGARAVVAEMVMAGFKANVAIWTSLLAACVLARPMRRKEAERIFRQMVHCDVQPNRLTLKTLARAVGGKARSAEICVELGVDEKCH